MIELIIPMIFIIVVIGLLYYSNHIQYEINKTVASILNDLNKQAGKMIDFDKDLLDEITKNRQDIDLIKRKLGI